MWVMSLPSSPRFSGAFGKRRKPDVVWGFGSLLSKSVIQASSEMFSFMPVLLLCGSWRPWWNKRDHERQFLMPSFGLNCKHYHMKFNLIDFVFAAHSEHGQSSACGSFSKQTQVLWFYSFIFSHTAVNLNCELRVGGNFSEKAPTLSPAGKFCIYKKRPWGFSPDYTPPIFSPALWTQNSSYYLCLTEGLSDSSITRLFYY